jgi:transcriptional regulator with XRE-family HTH domain
MSTDNSSRDHLGALGEFIRSQRRLANMSLRALAERTDVSNPYLSQIERGMHEPSVRVLKAIAMALDLSAETLLFQAGLLGDDVAKPAQGEAGTVAAAIRADPHLIDDQKHALLAVYHSYLAANRDDPTAVVAPSAKFGDTAVIPDGRRAGNGRKPRPRRGEIH